MKKHYKGLLVLLVFLFITLVVSGIGVTYAYYKTNVTGAVTAKTSDYDGELEVVSATHTITPAANTVVDTIDFYVKNYTGPDSSPTNTSEVNLSYVLTFTLPTWGTGCTNPISYKLYSVNASNVETEVTLSNNVSGARNFSLISAEKDHYRLKSYWNMTYNSAECYANKSGNVGISARIYQRSMGE